jgi:hypothetical protein
MNAEQKILPVETPDSVNAGARLGIHIFSRSRFGQNHDTKRRMVAAQRFNSLV